MVAGCNAATCVSALVCRLQPRDCSVVETFGYRSGANGHVSFCWNLATLHGGCVRLRGRWEGDGVTGVIVSALLFVSGCALVGTVCDRMPLSATVFICCCFCLFFL
ncbi:hypothetical protein TcCL_NonESM03484 [Trypanosoma cruzi]|uniref:Uncharacterized protein n=1 Tax=Trypanosoma cruzi (strain CL Brener) TaxID=353153 RepID=Q4CRG7_TRYCC|nr:uncharacterized protein Tc00.1047053410199.50 [Trypanosoma cruzi]EAN82873.1 hypothetical protein Tc00.1047053410199.50 [Trypanosoma cruzi]RNC46741.1 hypothetical protein TcCL_NonESM03484 [Trypanosoma cruzi]|eukprot:XP_804724.1 hypothetical protein Tc00.1047053410199.50 [Trypanosoma cruzi strain CL Brener]